MFEEYEKKSATDQYNAVQYGLWNGNTRYPGRVVCPVHDKMNIHIGNGHSFLLTSSLEVRLAYGGWRLYRGYKNNYFRWDGTPHWVILICLLWVMTGWKSIKTHRLKCRTTGYKGTIHISADESFNLSWMNRYRVTKQITRGTRIMIQYKPEAEWSERSYGG